MDIPALCRFGGAGVFTCRRNIVKPFRSEVLCRWVGVYFTLFAFVLASGCILLKSPKSPPDFALSDTDARHAGALALYSKGLLLESGDGHGDTNAAKEAACQAFRQALRLDPDNRRPLAALISTLTERERYEDALKELESFIARHRDDIEMRLEAARIADAANRPDAAARHCAAILAAQPNNRELAQALIRLYFQSGQESLAFATIRSQYERFHDSESSALPVQWAIHFTRDVKQPALALRCLTLAVSQRTNAAERAALSTLAAESQLMLGQTNAAMSSLFQAYRENPAFTSPLLRLGTLYAQHPDSTNQLARQAQQEKNPETTLLILAATQQALDDNAGAITTLRTFYARRMRAGYFPDEGFYLWLGSLIEAQKVFADSERFFLEALTTHPSSHEIKNFLAYMWAEKGIRLGDANRLANEALQDDPDNGAYLDTKGWILFKSGRAFDALQLLLRAAERDKDEPVILDHVGDVLSAAGRETEAIAFWTRSYRFDPQPAVAEKLRKHGVTQDKK